MSAPIDGCERRSRHRRSTAFNASGGRSRSAGSATARRIGERDPLLKRILAGDQAFHVDRRPLRWRGAAPPWRRRSGPEQPEAARRSTTTRAPARPRRCASDAVTASSVLTAPSSETTSAPRMRSPGRSRGSSPPHRPQLTTSDGLRLAASARRRARFAHRHRASCAPVPRGSPPRASVRRRSGRLRTAARRVRRPARRTSPRAGCRSARARS